MFRKIIYVLFLGVVNVTFSNDVAQAIDPILTQAQKLAFEYVQDRSKPIPIVAIAGCSAVGKTYFAQCFAQELTRRGVRVLLLHQDDYLYAEKIFDGYKIHPNLDHNALYALLSANQAALKKISKPQIIKGSPLGRIDLDLRTIDIIVFEGIYTLTGTETYNFAQYSSLRIFLDALPSNIVKWHAYRNKQLPFFKRFNKSDIAQHATCLLYEYNKFISQSRKNADYLVYKDTMNSYRLIEHK